MIKDIISKKQDYVNSLDKVTLNTLKNKIRYDVESLNKNPLIAIIEIHTWDEINKDKSEASYAK